jgi:hypothetical protein
MLVATAIAAVEMTPPRRTIIATDMIPCRALPDPVTTDYGAWVDTVWSDAPRVASQIECI